MYQQISTKIPRELLEFEMVQFEGDTRRGAAVRVHTASIQESSGIGRDCTNR